ncbi:MAG: Ada metal-binding domain-containing protein [Ferruginibacter sp.]
MIRHDSISSFELSSLVRRGLIIFGGNRRLKIYGRLNCKSGKRMNIKNRVFFTAEEEAIAEGYRPCGHCMKVKYKVWKNKTNPHFPPAPKEKVLNAIWLRDQSYYLCNMNNFVEGMCPPEATDRMYTSQAVKR